MRSFQRSSAVVGLVLMASVIASAQVFTEFATPTSNSEESGGIRDSDPFLRSVIHRGDAAGVA